MLLLTDKGDGLWECLVRPGREAEAGGPGVPSARDASPPRWRREASGGNRLVRFHYQGIFLEVLEELGKMPLPPYIKGGASGTMSGIRPSTPRSTAPPPPPPPACTSPPELLRQIQEMGVKLCYVTLHVGLGTFRPVKAEDISEHEMHSEYCMIPEETARTINETKRNGGRVICVGTTSCRTVESFAAEDGTLKESAGWTSIFIYPGYRFKVLDALVTNFHLPQSTLIMLVSALAGREHVLSAYEGGCEGALPLLQLWRRHVYLLIPDN